MCIMLSQTSVESAILTWLKDFVEIPHPKLGNWSPCPFARQARLNQSYTIQEGISVLQDGLKVVDNWDNTKEVVIIWYNNISVDELVNQTKELNHIIMPKNFVALEGHPDLGESINGVDLRFNLCPIIVCQPLDKLNEAADQLRAKGYYDHWDKETLDKIVNFRYNKS